MHTTRQLWRAAGAAAAIATVLSVPATAGAANRVDALQSRVARLEKTVAKLNTTVKKLQASLKTTSTATRTDVGTLQTGLAAAVTAIGTVQTDLAAIKPGAAKGACIVNLTAYHWWSNFGFVATDGSIFEGPGMAPDAGATPTGYLAGIDPTCAAPLGLTRVPPQATAEQVPASAFGNARG